MPLDAPAFIRVSVIRMAVRALCFIPVIATLPFTVPLLVSGLWCYLVFRLASVLAGVALSLAWSTVTSCLQFFLEPIARIARGGLERADSAIRHTRRCYFQARFRSRVSLRALAIEWRDYIHMFSLAISVARVVVRAGRGYAARARGTCSSTRLRVEVVSDLLADKSIKVVYTVERWCWAWSEFIFDLYSTPFREWRNVLVSSYPYHVAMWVFTRKFDSGFRCEFVHHFEIETARVEADASHPIAAANRNGVLRAMNNFVVQQGLIPFHTSGSFRERAPGRHGWYWGKDVSHDPAYKIPTEDHVIVSVDDDYYREISRLAWFARPMLIYTFSPTQPAGNLANGHYWTNEFGNIVARINGGANYEHALWDWSMDTVVFDYPWTLQSVVYNVERRSFPDQRLLVICTPVASVYWPMNHIVAAKRLVRRRPLVTERYAMIESSAPDGTPITAISEVNGRSSAVLPTRVWEGLLVRSRDTQTLSIWTLGDHLKRSLGDEVNIPSDCVPVLYAALRVFGPANNCQAADFNPHSGELGSKPENYISRLGDKREGDVEGAKLIGTQLHPAVTSAPATVPAKHRNNDVAAVVGRIERVRNTVPLNAIGSRYRVWAQEIAAMICPPGTDLEPFTIEQVCANMTTRSQRESAANENMWFSGGCPVGVRAFMKSETTSAYGDPRNISSVAWQHNIQLGQFVQAFKKAILDAAAWFAPGKALGFVARKLVDMAMVVAALIEADGSRFDGRVGAFQVMFERMCFANAFKGRNLVEFLKLFEAERNIPARTSTGVKYQVHDDRLSGSSITTVGNSLITMGLVGIAAKAIGLKFDSLEELAVVAGDDLVTIVSARAVAKTSHDLGMVHTTDTHTATSGTAVGFLGRKFPGLFEGSLASVQDPWRTLNKIHISFMSGEFSAAEKLYAKGLGIRTLESGNPLFRAWGSMAMRVAKSIEPGVAGTKCIDLPYLVSQVVVVGEYSTSWPQFELECDAVTATASIMGLPEAVILAATARFDAVKNKLDLEQLGVLFVCPDVVPKNTVVVPNSAFLLGPPVTAALLPTPSISSAVELTPTPKPPPASGDASPATNITARAEPAPNAAQLSQPEARKQPSEAPKDTVKAKQLSGGSSPTHSLGVGKVKVKTATYVAVASHAPHPITRGRPKSATKPSLVVPPGAVPMSKGKEKRATYEGAEVLPFTRPSKPARSGKLAESTKITGVQNLSACG